MSIRSALYLHGFASSPRSTKAAILGERLAARGVTLAAPDLNEPDFSTLTVTRMLDQTAAALATLPPGPVTLIGSSLGGFVAVHAAARQPPGRIGSLVLLAPAFAFGSNRVRDLGARGIDSWKATGQMEVFHHGYGERRTVGWALYEDASHYDAYALALDVPTVIIYGTRDESVDPVGVEAWAPGRSAVTLRPVDDGHQLTESMDVIWRETARALGVAP
jgi:hypothetical protein